MGFVAALPLIALTISVFSLCQLQNASTGGTTQRHPTNKGDQHINKKTVNNCLTNATEGEPFNNVLYGTNSGRSTLLLIALQHTCSSSMDCPPLMYCNNSKCTCVQHTFDGIVRCNDVLLESSVLDCHCITFENTTNDTVMC